MRLELGDDADLFMYASVAKRMLCMRQDRETMRMHAQTCELFHPRQFLYADEMHKRGRDLRRRRGTNHRVLFEYAVNFVKKVLSASVLDIGALLQLEIYESEKQNGECNNPNL